MIHPRRSGLAAGLALFLLLVAACSVDLEQTSVAPTFASPTETPTDPPTNTPLPPTETPLPPPPGETPLPTDTPVPSPTPLAFDYPPLDPTVLEYTLVPGWEQLGLEGKAMFLTYGEFGQAIAVFDFETGQIAPIFFAPENTWVLAASLLPDRSNLVMAYAPPPGEGETQFGYSDLFLLAPGDEPVPLIERTEDVEAFFSSLYTFDGSYIYYSWFFEDDSVDYGFRYFINRLEVATGAFEVVAEDAYWPAVSRAGDRLAYVTFDPNAEGDDPAALIVANADGTEPVQVLDLDLFPTVDAPFFSPEGDLLYFSAVSTPPESLSWLDRLMGVRLASAHTVPSDWFRVDLTSLEVERITEVYDQGMFGAFSPDGSKVAYISATGLWVMNPDGSGLVQVMQSATLYGNLEWIP